MDKGKFYIRLEDRLAEEIGYIDKENSIAYSDNDSLIWHNEKWTATDIETGCKLTTGRTLEECKSNVMQIMNKIIDRRNSNAGQMYREQFKQILNGELGNGVIKLENEYI